MLKESLPSLGKSPPGYAPPSSQQRQQLEAQGNWADDWQRVLFAPGSDLTLIRGCRFLGCCWIGVQRPALLRRSHLRLPTGLYHSALSQALVDDQVAIHHVHYLDRVHVATKAILFAVDELSGNDPATFGFGSPGQHSGAYALELGNENGRRTVFPVPGLLAADAWCWSRYRDRPRLLDRFAHFSQQDLRKFRQLNTPPGGSEPLSYIGPHAVLKNCRSVIGCWIGGHSYIKGANKLKNVTIRSTQQAPVQIGEGVELVNGIIDGGSKIFYGSKAVRFYCGENSQLKYGARLINSYIGANSTVSCCELLNSLLFPAHEQHHNNSFLIAATLGGQSNVAAGATLGSNHNSRAADGELVADRGFWPALNTSLKYNCRFTAYSLLTKGNYPAEINLPLPFSLVAPHPDGISVLPAYWWRHNCYALERNSWKFTHRDQRMHPRQLVHTHYLEADTAEQIAHALTLLRPQDHPLKLSGYVRKGELIVLKPAQAIGDYRQMLGYYVARSLVAWAPDLRFDWQALGQVELERHWLNCGGQIVPERRWQSLLQHVEEGKVSGWAQLHACYGQMAQHYREDSARYALYLAQEVLLAPSWSALFDSAAETALLIWQRARDKRAQDLADPLRQSCYRNQAESDAVLGRLEDDPFLQQLHAKQNHQHQLLAHAAKRLRTETL